MEKNFIPNSKIYNKDSRDMSEIKDSSINLIVTSPPYGNLKDYKVNNQIGQGSGYKEYLKELEKVWDECIRVLSPDGKLCINIMPLFESGNDTKFKRRVTRLVINDLINYIEGTEKMFLLSLFIWDKRKVARFSSFGSYPYPTNIFSTYPYEWIIVFCKEGKRKPVDKNIKELSKISQKEWADWAINSFWEMQPAKAKSENHPAPFPKELPHRLIKLYSFYGDTVLDPFMGSGTTAEAAIELGRNSVGYEINEDYIELINNKIKNGLKTFHEKKFLQQNFLD
ncbi:MAG: site-specific DNA-methyltransferase [Clostridia bacterium]|jgi:DNA modification methylase|nr:site-specific DNA-methyltransferase [Clostridia bacterium]